MATGTDPLGDVTSVDLSGMPGASHPAAGALPPVSGSSWANDALGEHDVTESRDGSGHRSPGDVVRGTDGVTEDPE